MKDIHLFVPTFNIEDCLQGVRDCLEKGWTGLGDKTVEFESMFCEAMQLPHGHFLNSATAGLHLAVKIFKDLGNWQDGDEIITTPLTFVSTNHAILYERLTPVFADVDQYLCLDPASVEERISPRTKALIFVGMGGNTGQFREIVDICRRQGLILILDAAHMAGTKLNGSNPALLADATVYSFQAVKNLATADSGMICFADSNLDTTARRLSWMGIDKDTYMRSTSSMPYKWRYEVNELGYKYHGNSIMAAIALAQLRTLEKENSKRRDICNMYENLLSSSPHITVIPVAPECHSSRHLFQVLVNNRDKVMVEMHKKRIFPGVHYRDNTEYSIYPTKNTCPKARNYSNSLISLPLHLRLTSNDIHRVAHALLDATSNE